MNPNMQPVNVAHMPQYPAVQFARLAQIRQKVIGFLVSSMMIAALAIGAYFWASFSPANLLDNCVLADFCILHGRVHRHGIKKRHRLNSG